MMIGLSMMNLHGSAIWKTHSHLENINGGLQHLIIPQTLKSHLIHGLDPMVKLQLNNPNHRGTLTIGGKHPTTEIATLFVFSVVKKIFQ